MVLIGVAGGGGACSAVQRPVETVEVQPHDGQAHQQAGDETQVLQPDEREQDDEDGHEREQDVVEYLEERAVSGVGAGDVLDPDPVRHGTANWLTGLINPCST